MEKKYLAGAIIIILVSVIIIACVCLCAYKIYLEKIQMLNIKVSIYGVTTGEILNVGKFSGSKKAD